MDSNIIVALGTSSVALLVACVSGLFSYYSTKRTTKVEKMKAYLQYLENKMSKLEEAQVEILTIGDIMPKSKNDAATIAAYLQESFTKSSTYLASYSYLFGNTEKQYLKLRDDEKRISLSLSNFMLSQIFEGTQIKEEYKDQIIPIVKLPEEISKFGNGIKDLIQEELRLTYKKFEDLSTN